MTRIEDIHNIINKIARQQTEYTERTLAEIITKYDFVVGSMECKHKLMKILSEGANIVYSPYIENPTMIYAIKKFDIMDLLKETYKAESEDKISKIKSEYLVMDEYGYTDKELVDTVNMLVDKVNELNALIQHKSRE